jgi:hypothetical protein
MTLEELTRPATRAEVEASIYAAVAGRGASTTTWKPGAVVRAIVTGASIVLAGFSQLQALIASGGFLELATGDWLTLVARYVFGVERLTATFATSVVTVDNEGGGVYAGDADDLVFRNSDTGKTYRNTSSFSIGAGEVGVEIEVQAVEAGTDSNAIADRIDEFETTLLGVVVVSSTTATAQDGELDPALKTRCRAKTGTLSPNGPRDAYEFVARSATDADGVAIGVTRVRTVPDGVGGIDVYVADATGQLGATPLAAVADAIHRLAEPLAITPDVQSATPKAVNVTYTYWIFETSGYTEEQIEDLVYDRLEAWMALLPIGGVVKPLDSVGRVYIDALEAVIGSTLPGQLVDVAVSLPAADVDCAANEAPVLGSVTATVTPVSGGVT